MRYIKVFLLVLIFFFVMLFFMDNQEALTARYPLTLDLRFFPAWTTANPVPFYFLLLAAFLLGGLLSLVMLLWDRVSLTTRAGMARMRAGSLERDLNRANRNNAKTEEELKKLQGDLTAKSTEIDTLKASLKETEARAIAAEKLVPAPKPAEKTA